MKYEFPLDDYWDVMDTINEREDVQDYGFRQIKIAEEEGSELYVYGYRIVIPELNMTVREGIDYYKDSDGVDEPVESIILYYGDEPNPLEFSNCYCNIFLTSLIGMIADERKLNNNPKCYIDDSEFDLWKDE